MKKSSASKKRKLLYDTAASLFAGKGYSGTSIRDLASALGLQKSSLYHYFDSKEDLLFRILDEYMTKALREIESLCALYISPLEKLQKFMQYYTSFYAGDRDRLILLVNELDCMGPDCRQTLIQKERRYMQALNGILVELQDQGLMKSIPLSVASFAFFGMVHYTFKWYRKDGPIRPEQLGDLFLEIFTRGIFEDRPLTGTDKSGFLSHARQG